MRLSDLQWLGPCAAFMSSITWATATAVYARLSFQYSGSAINFTRAFLALPFFVLFWIFFSKEGFSQVHGEGILWCIVSILSSYAIGDLFFFLSSQRLGTPQALALASSYPVLSAFGEIFLKGGEVGVRRFSGVIFVFLGTATVILSARAEKRNDSKKQEGVLLGVVFGAVAALFWSLNTFSVSLAGEAMGASVVNSFRMFFALILCPITGLLLQPLTRKPLRPIFLKKNDLKRYGLIFLFEAVLGSTFYAYGLSHSPLSVATPLTSLAPVLSVPVGLYLGTEKFSFRKTMGVFLVVSGIILL